MTTKEYNKICSIIDEKIKENWITPYYCKKMIDIHGVFQIKDELKKLIKE